MPTIRIQQEDFDLNEVYRSMRSGCGASVGAIVSFVGLVRDKNAKAGTGDQVQGLYLEHYPGMTEKSIERIVTQAMDRWPLLDVQVIHRVGEMGPTDQIVLVGCASAHRDAAFAGAEYIMDYLKTDAVFWKRERTVAGSTWIDSTTDDLVRAQEWQKPQEQRQ